MNQSLATVFNSFVLCSVTILTASAKPLEQRSVCTGNQSKLRVCADENLKSSDSRINETLPPRLAKQWHEATSAVCLNRWENYKGGSIYPMMILKCNDNLNRVLLKEFEPFGN